MELLLMVAFFGLLVSIIEIILKKQKTPEKSETKEKSCPPEPGGHHDWSYNKDNRYQCIKCNFIAGTHKSTFGDYS